jgi:hypothetical protein
MVLAVASTLGTKCDQRIKAGPGGGNVPSAAISIPSATNLDRGFAPVGCGVVGMSIVESAVKSFNPGEGYDSTSTRDW